MGIRSRSWEVLVSRGGFERSHFLAQRLRSAPIVPRFGKQCDDVASDDGAVGDVAYHSNLLRVGYSEPDTDWQVGSCFHSLDGFGNFFRDFVGRSGDARARNAIDETGSGLACQADACVRTGGRDQKNRIEACALGFGSPLVGFVGSQIAEEHAGCSRIGCHPGELSITMFDGRVGVAHVDNRGFDSGRAHRGEDVAYFHSAIQRALAAGLDRWAVRDRVAERDADFDQVGATVGDCTQDRGQLVNGWIATGHEDHEGFLAALTQALESRGDFGHGVGVYRRVRPVSARPGRISHVEMTEVLA